jgi:cation diffusion facilitator family transporter
MTADVVSSLAVLLGLILVKVTGYVRADAVVALAVAVVVVASGLRVIWRAANELLDRSLPPDELAALELTIASALGEAAISYHKLRARHSGATHYVDLHLQFRPGTSLEVAHQTSHRLTDAITGQLERADVTIHLEPGRDASDNVRLR